MGRLASFDYAITFVRLVMRVCDSGVMFQYACDTSTAYLPESIATAARVGACEPVVVRITALNASDHTGKLQQSQQFLCISAILPDRVADCKQSIRVGTLCRLPDLSDDQKYVIAYAHRNADSQIELLRLRNAPVRKARRVVLQATTSSTGLIVPPLDTDLVDARAKVSVVSVLRSPRRGSLYQESFPWIAGQGRARSTTPGTRINR